MTQGYRAIAPRLTNLDTVPGFTQGQQGAEKMLYLMPYEDERVSLPLGLPAPPYTEPGWRDSVEAVGRYMVQGEYAPAVVLTSRAERAKDIVTSLVGKLPREPAVFAERALHYAGADDLLQRLRAVSDLIPSLMLVANRHTIGELARALARGYGPYAARANRQRLLSEFPEGSFAALALSVDSWAAVAPKTGLLRACVRPYDLAARDH